MKQNTFYTSDMKMADLINSDYTLLLLLPRFGMELGFGEQTVLKYCREHAISAEFFLMICNIYSFENYLPDDQEIEMLDVDQLIAYLKKSHYDYLFNRLHAIDTQLQLMNRETEKIHGEILDRFFSEYKNEVIHHFQYEEETVFPYISDIAQGKRSAAYQIDTFEKNHTNIDDKLNDLKNILIKYLPAKSSLEVRTTLLYNLFDFEKDLSKHTLLEDLVLVPKVRNMEKKNEPK